MSEYQYYEFQAIDRPLTEKEMAEVRSYSSRARITPTSFVNDYSWGGFKGDEDAWMERYYDAFLYLANWGTRVLKFRLPLRLLDPKIAKPYCAGEQASVRQKGDRLILSFVSENEQGDDWVEGEGWLASLISVRAELARGDLRALYLAWLLDAQNGELDDEELEPPVPAGLAQLSASLESFVDFLRIDTDLVGVAAEASPALADVEPKLEEVRQWVAKLPLTDKEDVLSRLIAGNESIFVQDLALRFRQERQARHEIAGDDSRRRTVAELLARTEEAAEKRQRQEAEKAAREKARRERKAAVARGAYLDALAGKEPELWNQIDGLVDSKQPKKYDQAITILVDLRDLAARGDDGGFQERVTGLRVTHAGKRTFIERMDRAKL